MQVLMTASKQSQDGNEFHPDSVWKRLSKPACNLPVPNVQWKLLMMGKEDARNM